MKIKFNLESINKDKSQSEILNSKIKTKISNKKLKFPPFLKKKRRKIGQMLNNLQNTRSTIRHIKSSVVQSQILQGWLTLLTFPLVRKTAKRNDTYSRR